MPKTLHVLFLFCFQYVLIECLFPALSVNKIDRNAIKRKRQDTKDMCRIFNEEANDFKRRGKQHRAKNGRKRSKREISYNRSPLSPKDAQRVESIVDKLYDDVEDNPPIMALSYTDSPNENEDSTRKTFADLVKHMNSNPARRYYFAPANISIKWDGENDDNMREIKPIPFPWPKKWKYGIIPYFIDPKTYDTHLVEEIMKAFDYFEKATCIRLQRLREKPVDPTSLVNVEWVYISNPSSLRQCVHSNERKENHGVQLVVFGYDCMSLGEIVHEVMHVLGFSHEHTRPDRDHHISILWDNIKPGYKKYFELRTEDVLSNLPYDYSSVLHYPQRAFSKNGRLTIVTEKGYKIGQREALSETDVEKVGIVFGHECVERNKDYLLKTCPSVIKKESGTKATVSPQDIKNYFKDRIWPYGIVNYKLRDHAEFTTEEIENIKAVIKHIESETCIEFRDLTPKLKEGGKAHGKNHTSNSTDSDSIEGSGSEDGKTTKTSIIKKIIKHVNETAHNISDIITGDNKKDKDGHDTIINLTTIMDTEEIDRINASSSYTATTANHAGEEGGEEGVHDTAINLTTPMDTEEIDRLNASSLTARRSRRKSLNAVEEDEVDDESDKRRRKRSAPWPESPSRRHAASVMVFARSTKPGCVCPPSGRPAGDQTVEISADCFNTVNDLLHFFVHILGLDHQHNMHDRDSYLHIRWDQLTPDMNSELQAKLPPAASAGLPYDYQSVMHFPWLEIKKGVTNIVYPIWNDGWGMGHWHGLSSIDVQKLHTIYYDQCYERKEFANNMDKPSFI